MRIKKVSVLFFLGATSLFFAQTTKDSLSKETSVDEVISLLLNNEN